MASERALRRQGFDVPQRLRLVEDDLDSNDDRWAAFIAEDKAWKARMSGIGLAVLTSTVVAAIMLAINLAVGAGS